MGDNLLKKEFRTRDVQRMRNIITKNINNKTGVQVGYTKEYEEHKEGEIWEERGKKWTIKNGIKQTVTRFDNIKKKIFNPILCPNCNNPMTKGHLDKYMFSIHNKCSDCVFEYETKLKIQGKFEEYEKNIIKEGIKYHIKEMEGVLLELLMNNSEHFSTENGEIEEWKGKRNNKFVEDIQEYIQKLKGIIDN